MKRTYTTIQPNENLLLGGRGRVGRWKEPKEQLVLVVGVAADGQQPGIGLARIEVDLRNALSVDSKF